VSGFRLHEADHEPISILRPKVSYGFYLWCASAYVSPLDVAPSHAIYARFPFKFRWGELGMIYKRF